MIVELINTGTELLLGSTVNTHLSWLGENLFPLGLRIARQLAIPDGDIIREALLETIGDGRAGDEDWAGMAVAFVAATVTGFVAVRWLLAYIASHRFTPFAWYRIGLGAALLLGLPAGS